MSGLALGGVALLLVYGGVMADGAMERTRSDASRRVTSAPLVLEQGTRLTAPDIVAALERRGLRRQPDGAPAAGRFSVDGATVVLGPGLAEGTSAPVRIDLRPGGPIATDGQGVRLSRLAIAPVPIGTKPAAGVVRWWTSLEALPPYLVTAIVDAEDRSFPDHAGVSLRGVGRAALRDLSAGSLVEGGSTITQQLAKNLLFRPRRSVTRKLAEAWLAWTLETRYQKRAILEAYVNRIYLGQDGSLQIHGVEAAARHYFGCGARHLTPAEAALLAGMVAAPNRFDPFAHPDAARRRRAAVLDAMVRAGHLSAPAARALGEEALPTCATELRWPPAVQATEAVLRRSRGRPVVPSTIDVDVQAAVSEGTAAALSALEARSGRLAGLAAEGDPLQVAVVVVDRRGAVLAIQGSRSGGAGEYNRATDARRPVGSAVKPFVVAAALEAGIHADDVVDDAPLSVPLASGGVWRPSNDDRTFRGPVTVERALVESLNVPMVRTGLTAGVDRVADILRRFGLAPRSVEPAILLGAVEATPLEIASAYAALLDGGVLRAARFVRGAPEGPVRVLRNDLAAQLVEMLRGVVTRGTAAAVAPRVGGAVAAKTGTSDGRRDSWFVALRPRCVTVVWLGTDGYRSTGLYGSTGAMRVWDEIDRRLPASWSGGTFSDGS